MKNILKVLFVSVVVISTMNWSSYGQKIVKETPNDHSHMRPNVKSAGDYHVISFMDRRSGKIGIQVLNNYEEPFYIEEESIKAKIVLQNGKTKKIRLYGDGYGEVPIGSTEKTTSSIFSKDFPWVKEQHSVSLKVWVPLPDGKTYELTFQCKSRLPMPKHSGIVTK